MFTSWQDFMKRLDNKGLSITEARQKYLKEQLIFENQLSSFLQQQMMNSSSGGRVSQTPPPTPLYSATYQIVSGFPFDTFEFRIFAQEGYSPADGTEISIIYTPGDALFPKTFTITDGSIPTQSGGNPNLVFTGGDVLVSIRENGVEFASTTLPGPDATNFGYAEIANAINNA